MVVYYKPVDSHPLLLSLCLMCDTFNLSIHFSILSFYILSTVFVACAVKYDWITPRSGDSLFVSHKDITLKVNHLINPDTENTFKSSHDFDNNLMFVYQWLSEKGQLKVTSVSVHKRHLIFFNTQESYPFIV